MENIQYKIERIPHIIVGDKNSSILEIVLTSLLMFFEFLSLLIHPTVERLTNHNALIMYVTLLFIAFSKTHLYLSKVIMAFQSIDPSASNIVTFASLFFHQLYTRSNNSVSVNKQGQRVRSLQGFKPETFRSVVRNAFTS